MIDHIGIGCGNLARSRAFYEAALAPLGITVLIELTPEMTGGDYSGVGMGSDRPFFWFGDGGGVRGAGDARRVPGAQPGGGRRLL